MRKILSRPISFSTFDPLIFIFVEKYENRTENRKSLSRPFLRDPFFSQVRHIFMEGKCALGPFL
jgi:hypothetical protein